MVLLLLLVVVVFVVVEVAVAVGVVFRILPQSAVSYLREVAQRPTTPRLIGPFHLDGEQCAPRPSTITRGDQGHFTLKGEECALPEVNRLS